MRCEAFQALLTLHERGQTLNANLYDHVCVALSDDYEIVREVALKLIWVLGNKYPEKLVFIYICIVGFNNGCGQANFVCSKIF